LAASIPLEQDYHYWDATRTLPLPSHQTHKSTLSPTTVSALKASLADLNSGSVNSHSLLSMKMELHFPLDLYTIPMAHLPMANSYVYDPQVKFELSYLPTATQACFFAFTLLCPDLSLKCIFLMGILSLSAWDFLPLLPASKPYTKHTDTVTTEVNSVTPTCPPPKQLPEPTPKLDTWVIL